MQTLQDFQRSMPYSTHSTTESFPLWLGNVSECQLPTQYWLRLLKEHLLYLQKREDDFNTRQSYFFRQVMIDKLLER